jgi:hypothetical protein
MLRCVISTAVALVAGLIVLCPLSTLAQEPGSDQKPPEQAQQGEQKPEEKSEGDQKAADREKAEQEAAARAIAEFKEAAAKLSQSAGAPECVWTGRRIASLLWRDDIDTARRYIDLYDRFNCSSEHLKLVFRCVIEQGPLDPKAADRLASRVHGCWIAPQGETTAASQATEGSGTKQKTIPN